MATVVLYKDVAGHFEIVKRDDGDPDSVPYWEYDQYSFLSNALIKDSDARSLFLDYYLKKTPPLLLSDPNSPFDGKFQFPSSAYFDGETIVLFTATDAPEKVRLRELAKQLIEKKYLERDKLSIIHCKNKDCGEFSIGSGDTSKNEGFFCTKCRKPAHTKGSTNKKVTSVYAFSPELRDLLYKWRGRILEGIVYHQCKNDARIMQRFDVVAYPQLRTIKKIEDGKEIVEASNEKDIVLIDKEKIIPPIVILTSISSSQEDEKRQVQECSRLGLPTIFICARNMSAGSSIKSTCSKVFDNVVDDNNFPASLTDYIIGDYVNKI